MTRKEEKEIIKISRLNTNKNMYSEGNKWNISMDVKVTFIFFDGQKKKSNFVKHNA